MSKIGLREAIASLRSELESAITDAANKDLRFEVGEIKLEIQVQVEKGGKGGIKFWVAELGGNVSRKNTHTITIPLKPVNPKDPRQPVLTGNSQPD